jgi:hypothetical protein
VTFTVNPNAEPGQLLPSLADLLLSLAEASDPAAPAGGDKDDAGLPTAKPARGRGPQPKKLKR